MAVNERERLWETYHYDKPMNGPKNGDDRPKREHYNDRAAIARVLGVDGAFYRTCRKGKTQANRDVRVLVQEPISIGNDIPAKYILQPIH
jgi:hypothetical protein